MREVVVRESRYLFVVSVFFLVFFLLALNFRVFNPSLFDETNFRKLRRTLICARKKALFTFYARKKRAKVSRTEKEEDGQSARGDFSVS